MIETMPMTVMTPMTMPRIGQERAELVGPEGVDGHAEDFADDLEPHCSALRASTGSSLAARLAG